MKPIAVGAISAIVGTAVTLGGFGILAAASDGNAPAVAIGATHDLTDPTPNCELPVSQLNLRELEFCQIKMRAEEGMQRQFDELRERQGARQR